RAHTFCHVVPGVWYVMGVVLSAGGASAWSRDQCARDLPEPSRDDILVDEASATPAGADGVTFIPYLQGERTPHRDSSLRAAFVGLSLAHSRGHMTRAVLEGVCFALRDSLEILRELDLLPQQLLLTGGGAKSAFIRQLQADIFGLPVATVNREEGGAYGAVHWRPVCDSEPAQAIGALAIAPSAHNVLWAGTGETFFIRSMTALGDGVYRSTDAGRSWQHMGLDSTGRIARIVIDPTNP